MSDSLKKINLGSFIEEHGMNSFIVGQLVLVFLCGVLEGFTYMLVPYTMSQVATDWGLSSVATGSLSSWASAGCVVGGFLGGFIADKIGRRKAMLLTNLTYTIFTVLVFFAPDYGIFVALRFLTGIGVGISASLTVAYAAENTTKRWRTLNISIICSATPFGYTAASVVAMVIIPAFGWRPVYLCALVGFVFFCINLAFLRETPFWALRNGKEKEICRYLNGIRKASKADMGEITYDMIEKPQVVVSEKPKKTSYAALFSNKHLAFITIGAALVYFCAMCTMYGVNTWYPTLMLDRGSDVAEAYGFGLAMNAAGVVGNIAAGFLLQKIGRRNGEIFGFAISFVFILFMAFVGGPIMMVTAAMLVGFAINYLPSSVNAVTPEYFPTNARNSGVSFVMSCGRIAGFLSPILAGALLDIGLSHTGLMASFAAPCLVGILFVCLFLKVNNSDKTLDELEE